MIPLLSISGSGALLGITAQCLALVAPPMAFAGSPAVDITGDYRYAYHEPETAAEAKQIACLEALRQAISTTAAVRERTAAIVDSKSFHDLVHTLAAKLVSGQQILQQTDRGRTVYCKVKAVFHPDEVERVLLAQTMAGSEPGMDQNRALKILSTREDPDGTVVIAYQALRRLDWLSTAYQGTLRESADVMVDFYDEQGILLRSTRHPARKTTTGEDVMNPGQVGTLKVARPLNAKTYRVWLVN
ncbi:MAG: hypothetical protein H0V35_06000 [Nitrospira sp.]|nr:hypothetical protein [Nitrospira sp.]MBA3753703.1 hypothetical protein [Nitrospira sp.]